MEPPLFPAQEANLAPPPHASLEEAPPKLVEKSDLL